MALVSDWGQGPAFSPPSFTYGAICLDPLSFCFLIFNMVIAIVSIRGIKFLKVCERLTFTLSPHTTAGSGEHSWGTSRAPRTMPGDSCMLGNLILVARIFPTRKLRYVETKLHAQSYPAMGMLGIWTCAGLSVLHHVASSGFQ